MNQLFKKLRIYLYDVGIDINERLATFFINIGIIAAILGVGICLASHIPFAGILATAMIAVTSPLITALTVHSGHSDYFSIIIGVMIIIMIPIVWLTTGAESGGSGYWFLYELFYIILFTHKKQRVPFLAAAIVVIAAAIAVEWVHPELFFHFASRRDAMVCKLGSGSVVTIEILLTVIVQKSLYVHEREINTKVQDQTRSFVLSIANTIDTKDPYTGGHSRRVAECSAALALRLGMSQAEADNLYLIALLHDIGKIGVPDQVLNKPGPLTPEENAMIRLHPVYGAEILKNVTMLPHVCDGVCYHHERYDGTGYPEGLKGEEIPYIARVIAVADCYDAMSTSRVYRKYIKRDKIINEILRCRGTQFDPHIADVFVKMLMEGFTVENTEPVSSSTVENNMEIAASMMMRRIMEDTKMAGRKAGALAVDQAVFSNLYKYLLNLSQRYSTELTLIAIKIDSGGTAPTSDTLLSCTADLNQAITTNIRAVDICTRFGTAAYLLLLLNAQRDKIGLIVERIRTEFYRLHGSTDVNLSYQIIDPSTQEDNEGDNGDVSD